MQWRTNKLVDLRKQYLEELIPLYGKEESETMLALLIKRYFNLTRSQLAIQQDHRLSESEILRLHFAVKELKNHRPIQYILKHVDFLNTRILVNDSVLIPRPETEEMVQMIIQREKESGPLRILDIGTGSGCIAIALARNLPQARLTGIDISADALQTASKNIFVNEVMVQFEEFDILDPEGSDHLGVFDVIVSNPPYVTEEDKLLMKENVLEHEPPEALFVPGDDPLLFYKAIRYFAGERLASGGRIYFEINEKYGRQAATLFMDEGYLSTMILRDITGKDRFLFTVKS
jgi:release factor glutamine methyltransferase